MRIQCASIASTLHCAEPNFHVHVDFKWPHLHTATMASSSDLYFSQPSYCFLNWADTWNTVCSLDKRAHCRWLTRACMPYLFWSSHATRNCAIQINPDRNHLWKWIGIRLGLIRVESGLGECAFSVNALKPDLIQFNAHWVSSVNRPLLKFVEQPCSSTLSTADTATHTCSYYLWCWNIFLLLHTRTDRMIWVNTHHNVVSKCANRWCSGKHRTLTRKLHVKSTMLVYIDLRMCMDYVHATVVQRATTKPVFA